MLKENEVNLLSLFLEFAGIKGVRIKLERQTFRRVSLISLAWIVRISGKRNTTYNETWLRKKRKLRSSFLDWFFCKNISLIFRKEKSNLVKKYLKLEKNSKVLKAGKRLIMENSFNKFRKN